MELTAEICAQKITESNDELMKHMRKLITTRKKSVVAALALKSVDKHRQNMQELHDVSVADDPDGAAAILREMAKLNDIQAQLEKLTKK
jgi:hypothetical protein